MIITKTVIINLHPKQIKHFESLCYTIPRYIDKKNRSVVKKGTKIEVKVSDLPKCSNIKVLCVCDICGKERIAHYQSCYSICLKCSRNSKEYLQKRTGKNNPYWNPNLTEEERKNHKVRNIIPGYQKAMNIAKKLDNYCCVLCKSNKRIVGHHIQDVKHYPNLICDHNNITTLCKDHHESNKGIGIHNLYGKWPTKENWEEYKSIFFHSTNLI